MIVENPITPHLLLKFRRCFSQCVLLETPGYSQREQHRKFGRDADLFAVGLERHSLYLCFHIPCRDHMTDVFREGGLSIRPQRQRRL